MNDKEFQLEILQIPENANVSKEEIEEVREMIEMMSREDLLNKYPEILD